MKQAESSERSLDEAKRNQGISNHCITLDFIALHRGYACSKNAVSAMSWASTMRSPARNSAWSSISKILVVFIERN